MTPGSPFVESHLAESPAALGCSPVNHQESLQSAGGHPTPLGGLETLLFSLNRVVRECWIQSGPWASISANFADAAVVRSLGDHRLTVRVSGMGLALKLTNGLVRAFDE